MHESEIFQIARKYSASEQEKYLNEACAGDMQLLSDVKDLLAVYQRQKLPDSTATRSASLETHRIPQVLPVIERYSLQKVLGQGGMGTVYLAEQQQPVKRLVAIKLIRSEYAYPDIIARFHQERQTLALMDHPNIAKVLDAGMAEEKYPYLVMEYIEGIPITEYCQQQKQLGLAGIIHLFSQVCLAVQHAHQKGVIHRDLKPSNILVSVVDGVPIPKVIDFGTAKVFQNVLQESEINTVIGSLVGTMEYMSPEQAALDRDIDTRSDIYALGVVLYELLVGSRPFDRQKFGGLNYSQILEYLRHTDIPKPSSKLITGTEQSSESTLRRTDVIKLKQTIQGDLDWIVMKCLEKDRNHRYQTALQLSMELDRYLRHEPVQAGPPSWSYKLSKLIKRHKYKVIAASLVISSLVVGAAAATVGLVQARNAEHVANQHANAADDARRKEEILRIEVEQERDKVKEEKRAADAISDFLRLKLLAQGNYLTQTNAMIVAGESTSDAERDPRISTLLKRAEKELTIEKIEQNFPRQLPVQAALLRTVGLTYLAIDHCNQATELLERAEKLYVSIRGKEHPETLSTQNALAAAYLQAGRLQQAVKLFEHVHQTYVNTSQQDQVDAAITLGNLAHSYMEAGRYAESLTLRQQALDKMRQRFGEQHVYSSRQEGGVATVLMHMSREREAIVIYERLRDAYEKHLGVDHPTYFNTINNLAICYLRTHRAKEAIVLLKNLSEKQREKLGEEHTLRLVTCSNLGAALRADNQVEEALKSFEFVNRSREKALGPNHPSTLDAVNSLGAIKRDLGNYPEALKHFEHTAKHFAAQLGEEHPKTLMARHNLATVYFSLERWDEASRIFEEVGRVREIKLGSDHDETMLCRQNLAACYAEVRRFQDALILTESIWKHRIKQLGEDHVETITVEYLHARCLCGVGKNKNAISLLQHIIGVQSKTLRSDHPALLKSKHLLGSVYLGMKDWKSAVQQLEPVCKAREISPGPQHVITLISKNNLALCYTEMGRHLDALKLFEAVLQARQALFGIEHRDTIKVLYNYGVCLVAAGRTKEGIVHLEQALALCERLLGNEHDDTMACFHHLGSAYWKINQFDRAIAAYQREVSYCIKKRGDLHPSTLLAKANLGVNYKEVGQYQQALALLEQAYQARKQARTAFAGYALLECHLKLSQAEAAAQVCKDVVSDIHHLEPKNNARAVKDLMSLVNILSDAKSHEHAAPLIDEILQCYEQTPSANKASVLNTNNLARVNSLKGRVLLLRKNYEESEKYLMQANKTFSFDQPIKSALLYRWMIHHLDDLIQLNTATNKPDKIEYWIKQKAAFANANKIHAATGN